MGANEWQTASSWPPAGTMTVPLYLAMADEGRQLLTFDRACAGQPRKATFIADPRDPVVDPYEDFGPHDYRQLEARKDVLTFDYRAAGGRSAGLRRRSAP